MAFQIQTVRLECDNDMCTKELQLDYESVLPYYTESAEGHRGIYEAIEKEGWKLTHQGAFQFCCERCREQVEELMIFDQRAINRMNASR